MYTEGQTHSHGKELHPAALPFPNRRWMEEMSRAGAHHVHVSIWPQGSSSSHPAWVFLEASSSDHSSAPLVSDAKATYYLVQLEFSRPAFTLSNTSSW